MPDARLSALIEGDNGALLISMRGGIRQLVDGKPEAYPLPSAGRQSYPNKLLRDRDGGLWIGTADRGLVHMHAGRTDVFSSTEGLSSDSVTRLFEDREGNIWVATSDGIDRFRDLAAATISVKQGLSNDLVWSVLAARDGSVWLGTVDGLNRWTDGRNTIYRKGSGGSPGNVYSLFQDEGRRILVCTLSGAGYFDNGRFIPVGGVPDEYVHSIAGDRAGNLWISQEESLIHLRGGSVAEQIPWARLGRKDYAFALQPDPVEALISKMRRLGIKSGPISASPVGATASAPGCDDPTIQIPPAECNRSRGWGARKLQSALWKLQSGVAPIFETNN
jgi:ligand-binding sensor domain-containing protein